MTEKNIKSRIIHKHDTAENWAKATSFIPKQGELIVYDVDENYDYERIKVGDGETLVNDLPFAVPQADWNQTDETQPDYIKNKPSLGVGLTAKIVTELPSVADAQENVIYMILTDSPIAHTGYHDGNLDGMIGGSLTGFGSSPERDCLYYPIAPGKTYTMSSQVAASGGNVGYILTGSDSEGYYTGTVLEVLTEVGSFTAPVGADGVWLHVNKGEIPVLMGPIAGDSYKEYIFINNEFETFGGASTALVEYVKTDDMIAYVNEAILGGEW